MYRILVVDNTTGAKWFEYGFAGYLGKRALRLMSKTTKEGMVKYYIVSTTKLDGDFIDFIDCLLHTKEDK